MVGKELLRITNNNIELEAEYYQSKYHIKNPAVLLCHPHPHYGGNMYNNVVSAIFNGLVHKDIPSLRFNFRAVGKSTGMHSNGEGELSDTKSCIDFLLNKKNHEEIVICGYSYGAAIGCSAINYSDKIVGYIAISFPWDFMGAKKYKELSQSEKPKLFIQGNLDNLASYSQFEKHYNFYNDPKKLKIINGADHFYWSYEDQVSSEVLDFYKLTYL
jgi:alpha/beta superfamily hydrolase